MAQRRDVAIVLSGGGVNGVLMELGFLRRLRESELWPRVGLVCGTSAGALAGAMAALDRLDELEDFLFSLQPADTFRPNRLWRLPLLGLHEYVLPRTIAERVADPLELGRDLVACERELVVVATDASPLAEGVDVRDYELVYSSRLTPPKELAEAVFASAAISSLVLPVRVGGLIATDGGWVRNFPLAHAYARPGVRMIVAFRYLPRFPEVSMDGLGRLRKRLERFRAVPPIRAFIAELKEAEERARGGEPAHLPEMILRLTRAAIVRNTVVEEKTADERDESIRELARLRDDVRRVVERHVGRRERQRVLAAVDEQFETARFPFRHDRAIPRITVRASAEGGGLDPGVRQQKPWPDEVKRALIDRGYELADAELRQAGIDELPGRRDLAG
jgi:predicted acylesterase/phospholipase RssA